MSDKQDPVAGGTSADHPALTTRLTEGELELTGRLLQASNATFLAQLRTADGDVECVYKPVRGERPLWDFPRGTLALREVAAYEVSRIGGFDLVPVTVLTDGPLGAGSLQVWVHADEEATAQLVDLVSSRMLPRHGWYDVAEGLDADDNEVSVVHAAHPDLRLLAVFDALINNADRKGGHILASDGRVFGVDHGVSFHTENKLRTLLWGWAGKPLTDREIAAINQVRSCAPNELRHLLDKEEISALVSRANRLLRTGVLPQPNGHWPSIPWPPF